MNGWNIKSRVYLIVSGWIVLYQWAFSQYNTFSPFSRYGIGDVQENSLSYQKGMNNSGIALSVDTTAPVFINLLNPASISRLRLTVIEANGYYFNTKIVNKENYKVQQRSTNFSALAIGFPIKKHSGFCFGLMPYSFVGYQINQSNTVNNVGTVKYVYDGSGGLNKVFMMYGFEINRYFKKQDTVRKHIRELIKNLSFGINAHYIFGELAQTGTVIYPNNSLYYNFVNDRRLRINGVSADIGMQTYLLLNEKKNSRLNLGLVFSYPSFLKVINDYIAYNFTYTFYGQKYIVDTLIYKEEESGKLKLPSSVGLGLSYVVNNKWGINGDVRYTNWKGFQLLNSYESVRNNIECAIGGYYQPDRFATGKGTFWDRVIYRAGIGYNSGYQEYQREAVPLYSFSGGVSIPVGLYRSYSAVHISVQYALKRHKDLVIRENIFKLNIGITLNDRWFVKYKYD